MKIIHTSDWHLGAKLHEQDRGEDHRAFLAFLATLIAEEKPDALVVSGDVFDTRQPTPAAQKLYYDFLAEVARGGNCGKVVVTAGNHDSSSMLAAADGVLRRLQVEVVSRAGDDPAGEVCRVDGADGLPALVIAAVPFMGDGELANFARAAGSTAEVPTERLAAGFTAHYAAVFAEAKRVAGNAPVVVTGHCTVSGARVSDERSERGRQIGGLDAREGAAFGDADYVALGHLHIPQFVGEGERVRYSGSPLAMSFAEAGCAKSVTVVEFAGAAGGGIAVREVPVPDFTPLRVFEGGTEGVRHAVTALVAAKPALVYAAVRITEGEGELAPFWSELDSVVQGSGVRILLKENARPHAQPGSGLAAASEKTLSAMTPLEVATLRINEESDLTEEERSTYVSMVEKVIGEL